MDYLVSPPEETDWRIDPADFEAALVARWPDADLQQSAPDRVYAFDFTVKLDGDTVDGAFERAGQTVGLTRDLRLCAEVAAWFRTVVPAEQPLLFYDQGYNSHVALSAGITGEAIVAAYLAGEAA